MLLINDTFGLTKSKYSIYNGFGSELQIEVSIADYDIQKLYKCTNESNGVYFEISYGNFTDDRMYIGNIFENRIIFGPFCIANCLFDNKSLIVAKSTKLKDDLSSLKSMELDVLKETSLYFS